MAREYEYVIVGSGVAGATVAKRILENDRSASILILEAGPEVEAKNRRSWWDYVVQANGREHKSYDFTTDQPGDSSISGNTDFLVSGSRVMLYGGSTVHWGGWCLRLKPEDFSGKSNTGEGGDWPFEYSELAAYYPEAERYLSVCGDANESWNQELMPDYEYPIKHFGYTEADGEMIGGFKKNGIEFGIMPMARYRKCMTTGTCKYCPLGSRFSGQLVMDELRADERHVNLKILLGAPASRVLLESKSRVSGVRYLDPATGDEVDVHGNTVLICTGAYESPKLLMLSTSPEWKHGIGNDHDLLGRYLVSHSMLKVRGRLDRSAENELDEYWFQEYDFPTLMSRTFDTKEYQMQNKIFLFKNRALPNIDFAKLMIEGKRRKEINEIATASRYQELQAFMEEKGQYNNRLTLAQGKNRFGLPKMHLHFDRTPSAQKNAENWLKLMDKVVADMGYITRGTHPDEPDKNVKTHVQDPGGHHATGTCRMGATPEEGDTDRDMRVHGTENLFVCSNAAFPTGAAVNPTLTLAAMAMRLGDHLIQRR